MHPTMTPMLISTVSEIGPGTVAQIGSSVSFTIIGFDHPADASPDQYNRSMLDLQRIEEMGIL